MPKQNFQQFFQDGTRHFSGVDEVVLRNSEAVIDLKNLTRTSFGPYGQKKIVRNHFQKLIVTSDAETIIHEGEIQHPAAKMMCSAAKMMADQIGDGTNLVLVFGGELLARATELIRMGVHTREIVQGYNLALQKADDILTELSVGEVKFDVQDRDSVFRCIRTSLSSHQVFDYDHLASLVTDACLGAWKDQTRKFNTDNVRVAKALGGTVSDSFVVKGFVVQRDTVGTIRLAENAKIAVFATSFDIGDTETKMHTVFNSAGEMATYQASRETRMEAVVSAIAQSGATVVVCQSKISELGLHFLEKQKIMALQLPSAWDIKRVSRATGAVALLRIDAPRAEELGVCQRVEVRDVGSTALAFFENNDGEVSTIVVRGATPNVLEDVDRCLQDAVNSFQVLTKYPAVVPGGGACEAELACRISQYADTLEGIEQYGVRKFAEALEVVPKTIAENAGMKVVDFMAKLRAAHSRGDARAGVDIVELAVADTVKLGVLDVAHVKRWAFKFAEEVAVTLLRIDAICVSKPAGGPQPRQPGARDAD